MPSSVPGGSIPADFYQEAVINTVSDLSPEQTEVLNKVGRGSSINSKVYYTGQEKRLPETTRLGSAMSASTNTMSVRDGTGVLFKKWQMAHIYNLKANGSKDPATEEIVWITGEPSGDELTVSRGWGGSEKIEHPEGAIIDLGGTAEPENQEHHMGPVGYGFKFWNTTQRFFDGASADRAARATRSEAVDQDPLEYHFAQAVERTKRELQHAILHGRRQLEQPGGSPSTFGGVRQFLQTNVVNMNGEKLDWFLFSDVLNSLWETVDPSQQGKEFVCSYNTSAIIDTFGQDRIEMTQKESEIGRQVNVLKTRFGNFPINPMRGLPDNEIWLVDWSNFKLLPFEGYDWTIDEVPGSAHGRAYDEKFISGTFGFAVEKEQSMVRLYNFDDNLRAYDTYLTAKTG